MEDFNKEQALDDINEIMARGAAGKMSVVMKCIADVQDYLQRIHDDAFRLGFEKGIEVNKKVEDL